MVLRRLSQRIPPAMLMLSPSRLRQSRQRRKIPKERALHRRVLLAGGPVNGRTKAPAEAGDLHPTATVILLVLVGANHQRRPHVKSPAEVVGADPVNPSPPHLALVDGGRDLLDSHHLLHKEMGAGIRHPAGNLLLHHREIIEVTTGVVLAMHQGNLAVAGDPRVAPTLVMAQDRIPAVAGAHRLSLLRKEDLPEDGEAVIPDLMIVLAAVGDDEMMAHRQTTITTAATPVVPRMTTAIRSVVEKTKNGEEGELAVNKIDHPIKKQRVLATIPNADVSILHHPQPRPQSKLPKWAVAADEVVALAAERMPIFLPG